MKGRDYLGEFELMIMLSILHLGDAAYGVPLCRDLETHRKREVSVSSVYAALDRLEVKGMVSSRLGEATPERGGRSKRYFRVTQRGHAALAESRRILTTLWQRLPAPNGETA